MNAYDLEQILFEEIGYAEKPALVQDFDIPWMNSRPIREINWAVLLNNIPIAYFSRFTELDIDAIKDLHKKVWSQSRVPLLFVILPNEIRVYNGYEPPPSPGENLDTDERLLHCLEELTDQLKARKEIQEQLVESNHYERVYLETGAFWDTSESKKINHRNRADRQLIESMGEMRKMLTGAGLSNHIAYTLLGRSVFIRYLEDRGVLTSEWVGLVTGGKANKYLDVLQNHQDTYQLFKRLADKFNGDLFPIEKEEKYVTEKHLEILSRFLKGEKLETGQLGLWPYNFEYIPIELISHIYDTFIDDQRKSGAYYTPLLLADFILEETMGDDVIHSDMTILDPACGSGIFLVGAYRRLLRAWHRENGELTPNDLSKILKKNIFGVDKNGEAIRIAAFSLYLEMLNHLNNNQILGGFRFPSLLHINLLESDFFSEDEVEPFFVERKFDRIIGNMPWGQGSLTDLGKKWLDKHGYIVGDKQAAPAFMLRVPEFCKDDGEIALLSPAKSTLHVTHGTHKEFRENFFNMFHVRAIVNFAAMRMELFGKAISPSVAFFYTPNEPVLDQKLVYGVPKPSPLSQHLKAIVLDTTEIKFLDYQEILDNPYLWKVALWGTPRDAALMRRLKSLPTLKQQANQLNWEMGQGFQLKGSRKLKPANWLTGKQEVSVSKLNPYVIDYSECQPVSQKLFYTSGTPERFKAPLVLIRQSKRYAAFSNEDIAYKHKITGVAGKHDQEWLLRWLVAYINSSLAAYYHFLTSTSWAVERETIIQREYQDMPFVIPNKNDPRFQEILHYLDKIDNLFNDDGILSKASRDITLDKYKTAIDELVYELHNLHPIEQQLVKDTCDYGIEYFNWAKQKTRKPQGEKPVQRPKEPMMIDYTNTFIGTTSAFLKIKNQALSATVYKNGAPLTVVSFDIVDIGKAQPVQTITRPDAMRSKLRELDQLILEQKTPSMYIRRHVRIYDGNQISLVRPSEQRFWTQSQARVDADAFLAELSS